MNEVERVLAVLRGKVPDRVPWFADLSYWYVAENNKKFVPLVESSRDKTMVELHKKVRAGLYLNMGTFWDVIYEDEVSVQAVVDDGYFFYRIETPLGSLEERRRWSWQTYSWGIEKHLIDSVKDFEVVKFAMSQRKYVPRYERYFEWQKEDPGLILPFTQVSYSGLGFLMARFMDIQEAVYAMADSPEKVQEVVDAINKAVLREVDVAVNSPSPVIFISDNLSSDVQSPKLFERYSLDFYTEMCRRAHKAGKFVSVHVDGRMHGLLALLRECGVDCIDAVTPKPNGDLSSEQCREEAGDMVLWGGIPTSLWKKTTSDEEFEKFVERWLSLRLGSPRMVLAPGDQVPPGTEVKRIEIIPQLIEQYGRY